MTCYQKILCPECQSSDIIKAGFTAQNKQRYRCRNAECKKTIFLGDYTYRACLPEVKQQMIDMAINGSGMRDTARVLKISRQTLANELKKRKVTG